MDRRETTEKGYSKNLVQSHPLKLSGRALRWRLAARLHDLDLVNAEHRSGLQLAAVLRLDFHRPAKWCRCSRHFNHPPFVLLQLVVVVDEQVGLRLPFFIDGVVEKIAALREPLHAF